MDWYCFERKEQTSNKALKSAEYKDMMKGLGDFFYIFICLGLWPVAVFFNIFSLGRGKNFLDHVFNRIEQTN